MQKKFIESVEKDKRQTFLDAFDTVDTQVKDAFSKMTGGSAWLELENEDSNAALSIEKEIEKSINYYKSEAIILGCAGMADFAEKLEE